MATHSSALAWRIPGTGEPGGLPSVGSHSRTRLKRLSSSRAPWDTRLPDSTDTGLGAPTSSSCLRGRTSSTPQLRRGSPGVPLDPPPTPPVSTPSALTALPSSIWSLFTVPPKASVRVKWERIHLQGKRGRRLRFHLWVKKIPWRRKWQVTPLVLPGKFHGQRSLAGYSPWGSKELDMTEHTQFIVTGSTAENIPRKAEFHPLG